MKPSPVGLRSWQMTEKTCWQSGQTPTRIQTMRKSPQRQHRRQCWARRRKWLIRRKSSWGALWCRNSKMMTDVYKYIKFIRSCLHLFGVIDRSKLPGRSDGVSGRSFLWNTLSILFEWFIDVVMLFDFLPVSSKIDLLIIYSLTASGPRSAYFFMRSYSPFRVPSSPSR